MTKVTDVETLRWGRLYAAGTFAGACLGILVVLGLLPYIPPQLTGWMRSVDDAVATVVVVLGGAAIGFALAAVAHLGVRWQLRRRSRFDAS